MFKKFKLLTVFNVDLTTAYDLLPTKFKFYKVCSLILNIMFDSYFDLFPYQIHYQLELL